MRGDGDVAKGGQLVDLGWLSPRGAEALGEQGGRPIRGYGRHEEERAAKTHTKQKATIFWLQNEGQAAGGGLEGHLILE